MSKPPLQPGREHPNSTRSPELLSFSSLIANLRGTRGFDETRGGVRRADNPQYQLTRAEYPAGAPFNGAVDQWTYDAIGNRTSANQNGTALTYQYQQNTNNPQNGQLLNTDGVNTLNRPGFSGDSDS